MSGAEIRALRRQVGVAGAVTMGLGSIVGTGVFVSLGLAAELAGPAMTLALVVAAVLAAFNGMSSAQLAAAFPVSGGTYEYAWRTIGPGAGFTAGWMFLTAKSASAATAALGFAGYVLHLVGGSASWTVPVALLGVLAVTATVHGGVRRTGAVNALLVTVTLAVLCALVAFGAPTTLGPGRTNLRPFFPATVDAPRMLEAAALMFVAYTGYGRIATLGEEVVSPRRTIPRAIVAALAIVLALYAAVALTALGALGPQGYAAATRSTAAPLEAVARALGHEALAWVVGAAAVAAMLGVLLNLLLGLSRVLLAMARRGDAPRFLARVDATGTTPGPAVLATGVLVAALVLVGDVKATWSFSAFTVLVYYALTNVAALRLPPELRLHPRWMAWAGLVGCAFLAVWVEPTWWALGLGLLALGHLLRALAQARR